MAAKLELENYEKTQFPYNIGKATFVDGESKSADFDTKNIPLNLAIFNEGTVTLKAADLATTPTLNVNIVAKDHKTGDWRIVASFTKRTTNGSETIRLTDLTRAIAIDATLSGGSFTITITGEFFRK